MRRFAQLYATLDDTRATSVKLAALRAYLAEAPPEDAPWGLWFLSGHKLQRLVASPKLLAWTAEALALPAGVVEESYAHVGDMAETLALLWDTPFAADPEEGGSPGLSVWVARLEALRGADEATQRAQLFRWWRALPLIERFVLTKLVTGSLRVGVSSGLVARAVAQAAGLTEAVAAQRLMGDWQPSAAFHAQLFADATQATPGAPYPFNLAAPVEELAGGLDADGLPSGLGPVDDWLAEWKWDGIRAQLIRRAGQVFVWSRGEDLMNGRFPEVETAAARLPDGTVLDGEILALRPDGGGADGDVAPFAQLQRRIGRKKLGAKLLAEAPVGFLAYDLLEWQGADWRERPLRERRAQLEAIATPNLRVSPRVVAADWTALAALRAEARERRVEGLMLKRLESAYQSGRKRGHWWKWKIGALTVDCVLLYAQAGHGRRSNLYTDYTLACWDGEGDSRHLVPVAKAYSGLTDAELVAMDRWIRRHTLEKFGPVRSVDASAEVGQVFEIAFEGIQASPRHKSGVALRFPRIARWRQDKKPPDADELATLKRLIAA